MGTKTLHLCQLSDHLGLTHHGAHLVQRVREAVWQEADEDTDGWT